MIVAAVVLVVLVLLAIRIAFSDLRDRLVMVEQELHYTRSMVRALDLRLAALEPGPDGLPRPRPPITFGPE